MSDTKAASSEIAQPAHTPGPWAVKIDARNHGRIYAQGEWIALTWATGDGTDAKLPAVANAALIAAAPSLLSLCETYINVLEVFIEIKNARETVDHDLCAQLEINLSKARRVVREAKGGAS